MARSCSAFASPLHVCARWAGGERAAASLCWAAVLPLVVSKLHSVLLKAGTAPSGFALGMEELLGLGFSSWLKSLCSSKG